MTALGACVEGKARKYTSTHHTFWSLTAVAYLLYINFIDMVLEHARCPEGA